MSTAMGLERAAVSMLRTLGGRRAWLLAPRPGAADGQCGLGLAPVAPNEVVLEPVLLRTPDLQGNRKLYALVTQCTVRKAIDVARDGESEIEVLQRSMLRVNGNDYYVRSVTVKWSGGLELLYELEIEE